MSMIVAPIPQRGLLGGEADHVASAIWNATAPWALGAGVAGAVRRTRGARPAMPDRRRADCRQARRSGASSARTGSCRSRLLGAPCGAVRDSAAGWVASLAIVVFAAAGSLTWTRPIVECVSLSTIRSPVASLISEVRSTPVFARTVAWRLGTAGIAWDW